MHLVVGGCLESFGNFSYHCRSTTREVNKNSCSGTARYTVIRNKKCVDRGCGVIRQ